MSFVKSFVILFSFYPVLLGTLDRIQKMLDKNDFEKAEKLIIKEYEKDPNNPGVPYLHAKLLFTQNYYGYNADSAQAVISKARVLWDSASPEMQKELTEVGITTEAIDSVTTGVRSHLFKRTLQNLSVESINDHLGKYPDSPNRDALIFKRDSIDFEASAKYNTKEAYIQFIESHPSSSFIMRADSILDFMRYSDLERDGVLNDYYAFRTKYPISRHMGKIEEYILKISTASHDPLDLETFIKNAKTEEWKGRAKNLLFFMNPDSDLLLSDSLKNAKIIQKENLIPTVDQNGIGFLNESGTIRIENRFSSIQEGVKCEVISDSWIFVQDDSGGKIILKDGFTLFDQVQDYKDVSNSVGMLKKSGAWYLFHKSGFQMIESPIESAEVVDNHWIKVKKDDKWGL